MRLGFRARIRSRTGQGGGAAVPFAGMEAITRVGVVGLGTMGAGIAQVLLEGGCEVVGRDVDEAALERARSSIESGLARRVEKGQRSAGERDAALARLTLVR